jgi:mRNA interferase HicA
VKNIEKCYQAVTGADITRSAHSASTDSISKIAYTGQVKSSEFKRWLARQGATFTPAKGSHFHVYLNGRQSIIPMHQKDIPTGTVEVIKKQLGLK